MKTKHFIIFDTESLGFEAGGNEAMCSRKPLLMQVSNSNFGSLRFICTVLPAPPNNVFLIVSTRKEQFHVIIGNIRVLFYWKEVLFVLMLFLLRSDL